MNFRKIQFNKCTLRLIHEPGSVPGRGVMGVCWGLYEAVPSKRPGLPKSLYQVPWWWNVKR